MKSYIKNISYIIVVPLLLTAWLVKADYYQQLKKIEEQRLDDLASTKAMLEELSEERGNFNKEEKNLYRLLKGHSDTMHSNFESAESILSELVNSDAKPDYKGRAHSILAAVLHIQGKYENSFYHLDKSLTLTQEMSNKIYKTNILQNALSFYNDSGMLDYAMEYARRLLKHSTKTGDDDNQCQAHYEMAVIELSANKIGIADERVKRAFKFCHKSKEPLFLLSLSVLKADIAIAREQFSQAKKILEKSYIDIQKYGWKILNSGTEARLAEVYLALKDFEKAEELAEKSLHTANDIGDIKRSKYATKVLAKLYSELDEKDKAIKHYKKYIELEQKLSTSSRQRKLAYDSARQRIRIERLAKLEKAN